MPEQASLASTQGGEVSFVGLGLPAVMVHALRREGIATPFPIQAATIPDVLSGKDVLGRGPTGSGKTLAFGLPMLVRLTGAASRRGYPRAVVLVPTRELATQIERALDESARSVGLRVASFVGGIPIKRQVEQLSRGVDLLVATPGRLADHLTQKTISLDDVVITTLDEADQMADLGFMPQVTKILDKTPPDGQRLLFSATLDGDVDKLVKRYLRSPVSHSTAPAGTASVATMEHHLLFIDKDDKRAVVAHIGSRAGRTIMFVRTKFGVDRLAKQLHSAGISAGALHGDKAQNNRTRTLAAFADGTTPVLVATDVAARGIHVDDVSLVVHVDPPADPKDYVHRAGRTARAGKGGVVVTLVTDEERAEVEKLTRKAGITIAGVRVRPDDLELTRITGACPPSGVAVPAPDTKAPAQNTPRRGKQAHDTGRPTRKERPGDTPPARGGSPRGRGSDPASTSHGRRSRGAH